MRNVVIDLYFVGRSFFFQAGDGIRDVERFRGLGDVYKGLLQKHMEGMIFLLG